jgi:hypothetical protein
VLVALAWRNLWRQPVRTGLSLLSIAFASAILVFMLSFQLGVYGTMKANALRLFDGFAQIQPRGYADDPDLTKTIDDPHAVAERRRRRAPPPTRSSPAASGALEPRSTASIPRPSRRSPRFPRRFARGATSTRATRPRS